MNNSTPQYPFELIDNQEDDSTETSLKERTQVYLVYVLLIGIIGSFISLLALDLEIVMFIRIMSLYFICLAGLSLAIEKNELFENSFTGFLKRIHDLF